jgi:DNA-directed RNA polymerase II subunit RPB1
MFIEYKMEYNIDEIVNINKIQFCVFGNDEVKRYSVVNKDPYGINIPETYDSHEPKRGGLIDSRLGTTDYQVNCATCGLNNDDCPGHFGHTDLAEPVFHFGFIESVKNIMGCICIRCSKLLIYKTEKEMNDILKNRIGKARFDEIKRLTSNITYCQNPDYSCGAPISSIRIHESGIQLVAETKVEEGEEGTIISNKGKQKIQEILSAEDTYNILKNVSDIDCRIMGFDPLLNRPENLIITIFPIPPVAIRPTIRRDAIASKSFEDSMTDKLADIIKRNVILRTNKEKSAMLNEEFKYNDSHHQALQYHIATYFDNETSVLQKSEQKTGGRLYKSVSERLKGKQGRVRGNLLGKRTNFSGRTVITSNPDVGTDELGVPLKLAMTLTFPEVVTPQNVGRLTKLVKNGRDNYPGANYVYPKGNTKRPIDLRYRKKNIRLYYGDIVERHLIDGDYVLYNRQPSLHKLSMMGHRIIVLKDPELTTFGMNVSVTAPYNADYDGDEMNIFVPQSIQSSIELEMIANVRNQIIAPAATNIKIATKQDAPLGVYLLTREYAKIDYRHASDIISKIRNLDIELEKKDDFVLTNDIFSSLLPKKLNIVEYDDKGEKKLEILNGKLLKGVLNSKVVNGTILNTILDQFGNDIATDYIDNLQRLILQYLLSNGTTVGLKDVIISKDALLKCKDMLRTKKVEVECMLTEIENNPDLIDLDTLEINMTSLLQSVTGDITKVTMADLDKNNNLAILVNSGAKGKPDQVSSMSTARGQIVLNFARIKKKINNRTFPHYFQNDDRPEARGYLESSLLEGQSPLEFFMDAMTGREGLIDTAIKTADSGYINRRLIKCMEDVAVHYDGTIRNGNNVIVQYVYGDSHLDQVKQKNTKLKTLSMNNEKLKEKYYFNDTEIETLKNQFKLNKNDLDDINNEFFEELKQFRNKMRICYRKSNVEYKMIDDSYYMPVSFHRIIDNARYGIQSVANDLDPIYIMESINYILDQKNTQILCMTQEEKNSDISMKVIIDKTHKTLFKYGLYEYLAPKRCILEYKLDKTKFNVIVKDIINSFNKCLVEPGEMVGCVGSQSIGEQTTQMCCHSKTFVNIYGNNDIYTGEISKFVNKLLKDNHEYTEDYGNNKTILNMKDDYYICSVNNDGKTSWSKIGQIAKLPANGGMVEVTTKTGKKTIATLSHSFLKKTTTGISKVLGSKLKVGDRIPIAKFIPQVPNPVTKIKIGEKTVDLDWELGWLCGIYLADGSLNGNIVKISKIHPIVETKCKAFSEKMGYEFSIRNHQGEYGPSKDNNIHSKDFKEFLMKYFNTGSFDKEIGSMVYHSNNDFIAGIISGYFDGDGNISSDKQLIRVGSVSEKLIKDINRLLGYFGIFGSFYTEKKRTFYCLSIQRKYAEIFENDIGLELTEKKEQLQMIVDYNNRDDKHSELELVDKIPCVGNIVAETGKLLKMPGQSRNYGRWAKCESIGRNTIAKYIQLFEEQLKTIQITQLEKQKIISNIDILKTVINSDVIWDEIIDLTYLDDPKDYVYDIAVPGNETFMVDDNILIHNTLNTKHSSGAGVAGMQGIPRLNEILRKSENIKTPIMYIYLNKEKQEDKDLAYTISAYLKYTSFKDIVKKIDIIFDSDLEDNYMIDDEVNIKSAMNLYGNFNVKPENLPWLYRFEISKEGLFEKKINMLEIKTKFINFWDELIVDKSMNKNFRELIKKIINGCIMTTNDNSNKLFVHIRFDITEFDNSILLDIQNMILYYFQLKGIANINDVSEISKKVYLNFNEETGDIENKQEYIITTDGINANRLRYIKYIDNNRCYFNEINTIYRLFGIEATRKALICEINKVFSGDLKLNYHHLSILCDVMTNSGEIVSIDRHGFGRMDTDPLSKASFEKTVEMFVNSAVFGEVDHLRSVSSRLIMGRAIRCGTGFPEIIIDTEILENTEYSENELSSKIINSIDTLKINENTLINDIIERTMKEEESNNFMI